MSSRPSDGLFEDTYMIRWPSVNGSGRNSTAFTRVNTVVLAPMPTASTSRMTRLKPGLLRSTRTAKRRSSRSPMKPKTMGTRGWLHQFLARLEQVEEGPGLGSRAVGQLRVQPVGDPLGVAGAHLPQLLLVAAGRSPHEVGARAVVADAPLLGERNEPAQVLGHAAPPDPVLRSVAFGQLALREPDEALVPLAKPSRLAEQRVAEVLERVRGGREALPQPGARHPFGTGERPPRRSRVARELVRHARAVVEARMPRQQSRGILEGGQRRAHSVVAQPDFSEQAVARGGARVQLERSQER